jgi:hypothetical protein
MFAKQIENSMSAHGIHIESQSKAKVMTELEEMGLIQRQVIKSKLRVGTASFEGWVLTPAGHMAYCMSCEEVPDVA